MPTRSLNSSVLRWPDGDQVLAAAARWADRLYRHVPGVVAVGCFGSYARGDAGVGSDLDLLVITESQVEPVGEYWAVDHLPVPTDRLVYSSDQWARLAEHNTRFYQTLRTDTRWLNGMTPD